MSLLDDFATRLVNQSVCTIGTDLFEGRMPPTPDVCISLHEVLGQSPIRAMSRRTAERPNVRMQVRGTSYDVARAKAVLAFNALDGYSGTLNGTRYLFIEAVSSLIHLGPDEKQRDMFSCTFKATVGA